MEADMLASLKNKEKYSRYFGSLKYALYVITHPLDGFWDLTHEKRGSIAAANTIEDENGRLLCEYWEVAIG